MLPLLVVHGPLIWKLVLGAFVAAMLVATWVLVRWRERRRILGSLRIRNGALCELREGQVVLSATYHDGWLELEDHRRIELDGPVHIVFGTHAGGLRNGDTVTARGLASYAAAAGTGDYRDAAGGWTLRADPKVDPQITLAATRPAVRPRLLVPLALALVVATAGGYAGIHAIQLYPTAPSASRAEDAFPPLGEIALAAMLPNASRERALHEIDTALRYAIDRSLTRDAMRDELGELLELGCRSGHRSIVSDQLEDNRYMAVIASARACGDPRRESVALTALARYDEAFVAAPSEALIAALALDRPEAVAIARHAADVAIVPERRTRRYFAALLARTELPDDCVAGTDYSAAAGAPFAAELVTGPPAYAWLVQFVPPTELDDPKRMHVVALAIVNGDVAAATTAAHAIQSRELRKTAIRAIQLRSGAPLVVEPEPSDEFGLGSLLAFDAPRFGPLVDECDLEAPLAAARRGDGWVLAMALRRHACTIGQSYIQLEDVLEVLPHVATARGELAESFRTHPPIGSSGLTPTARAAEASLRRDIARMLGDRDEADRQDAIVKRAVAVLGKRERVVAFREYERIP